MKILLVNPPRFHELVGKNPGVIEENRGYNPPLGILSLGTMIRHLTGDKYDVELLDCQPRQLSYEWIEKFFKENQYDVVGLTTMTFTLIDVCKTVEIIKKCQKNCKVVLGGSHVHIFPKETLQLDNVDYIIQGEGEYAFIELLNALTDDKCLTSIPGLGYKHEGLIFTNGIAPKINDLDKLPPPDRTLLPIDHYSSLLGRNNRTTTMFTSRGCPYQCRFCDRPTSKTISGFRWRSAKSVVDEIEMCVELGIPEILIYDDTFSVRKDRVFEICDEIQSRQLKVVWDVRAHVNTVNKKLLKEMKKAGCDRIHYGVESGNDRMLKKIKKGANIATVKQAFKDTRDAGIEVLAYFMVGLPTETTQDIQDINSLARELKPSYCHYTIFCPYPDTAIYNEGLEKGIIKSDLWREFAINPHEGFQLPVWEENFTRAELQEILVKLYKDFYMRPSYILKRLARVRSMGELRRKAKAGISVLTMQSQRVDKLDLSKAARVK